MSYYGGYYNDNEYDDDNDDGEYYDDDNDDDDNDDDENDNNDCNNDNSVGYSYVNNNQASNSYAHDASNAHGVNNNGQVYASPVEENDSEYEDDDDDGDQEGEADEECGEEEVEEEEEYDEEDEEYDEEDEECDEEEEEYDEGEEQECEDYEYDENGEYIEQDEEDYNDGYVATNGAKSSQGYVTAPQPLGAAATGLTAAIAASTALQSATSTVNMPSGIVVEVSIPIKPCTHSYSSIDYNVHLMPLRDADARARYERALVANEMTITIKQHALQQHGGGRFSSYDIVAVHKVQNCCLWRRFCDKLRQLSASGHGGERMLFHGSTAADAIIRTGFDKKCAKTSGMFGNGIYFAEHSSKSNQYVYGLLGGNGCPAHTDKNCYVCLRKILLCRVALGRTYRLKSANAMASPPAGFHSVSGQPGAGLVYPEYTVYNEDQVYPEYLITYRIVR